MTTKRCFKCLCEKPLDAFYAHSKMRDGHLNKCKECTKKDVDAHRQENLEKIRQYDRMRASVPHRAASRIEIAKRWIKENPQKREAHHKVASAVRSGKITKTPCHICGNIKSEAHHPDYDRPLDVVWLCTAHHRQAHVLAKKLEPF